MSGPNYIDSFDESRSRCDCSAWASFYLFSGSTLRLIDIQVQPYAVTWNVYYINYLTFKREAAHSLWYLFPCSSHWLFSYMLLPNKVPECTVKLDCLCVCSSVSTPPLINCKLSKFPGQRHREPSEKESTIYKNTLHNVGDVFWMKISIPSSLVITTCVIAYSDCRSTIHQGDASSAVRAHDTDRKSEFWFRLAVPDVVAPSSMKELCHVDFWYDRLEWSVMGISILKK